MAGAKSSQGIQYCVTSMLVFVLIVSPHSVAQKAKIFLILGLI